MEKVHKKLKDKINENSTVVLSLSGGVDSMVLYDLLKKLDLNQKIICVHFNHNLRKESKFEEEQIVNMCEKDNNAIKVFNYNKTGKKNMHDSAREYRYEKLLEVAKESDASIILTAHHEDDLVETFLFKVIRGTTLQSLSSLKKSVYYENIEIYRPLLELSKQQILDYALENNIKYFEDSSNKENAYSRNYIRNVIIPLIKDNNLMFSKNIDNLIEEMEENFNFISREVDIIYSNVVVNNRIDINRLLSLDDYLIKQVIKKFIWREYQTKTTNLKKEHLNKILLISKSNKPSLSFNLPEGKVIYKDNGFLYFDRKSNHEFKIEFNDQVKVFGFEFKNVKEYDNGNDYCCLYTKELSLPLYIRNARKGEKIVLKGLNKHKKISDIFIDEKISKFDRKNFPILVDSEDKIVWIPMVKKSIFCKSDTESYDIIIRCSKEKKNE